MVVSTRKRTSIVTANVDRDGGVHDTTKALNQSESTAPAGLPPAAAVPTPSQPAEEDSSQPKKRSRTRKTPQDIGTSALILGGGADVQEVAAAADAVDGLPLATAGFTRTSLQAACDYLAQRDPSECCRRQISLQYAFRW
jgi:hypothetical protein